MTLCPLLLAALLVLGSNQDSARKAEIGEIVPDFAFRDLTGGDGRERLSELRGQPVFLVNWTDTDFGRGAAEQLANVAPDLVSKGLVAILHDSHRKTLPQIESGVLRLFPGNVCWLSRTQKLPIAYVDNGPPPDIALIGVDGTLLLAGSHASDFNKAVKLAKLELKKLKSGWGGHKLARKARGLAYGKAAYAEAALLLEQGLRDEPGHAELMEVLAEITLRRERLAQSVTHAMETGRYVRAEELARLHGKAVGGHAGWETEAAELGARLETDAAQEQLRLAEELNALIKPWSRAKPKAGHVPKLRKLAGRAGDTSVGRRADHLADLAELVRGGG